MIAPVYEKLAKKYENYATFLKVSVDDCPDIATQYEVQSMPTFLFMKKGRIIDRFSGASVDKLTRIIEDNVRY